MVALAGLGAWLVVLGWPFLQTLSPDSPPGQLLQIAERLAAANDLTARVELHSEEAENVEVLIRYVAAPALRIDILRPEEMAGEIYTLREIVDGWLLVHYRPREGTGVEIPLEGPDWLVDLFDVGRLRAGLRLGRVSVSSPEPGLLDVRGPPGPFYRLMIQRPVEPEEDDLFTSVEIYSLEDEREVLVVRARLLEVKLDHGTEFRELLLLPDPPRRWFRG